jgi:hypothetical protein
MCYFVNYHLCMCRAPDRATTRKAAPELHSCTKLCKDQGDDYYVDMLMLACYATRCIQPPTRCLPTYEVRSSRFANQTAASDFLVRFTRATNRAARRRSSSSQAGWVHTADCTQSRYIPRYLCKSLPKHLLEGALSVPVAARVQSLLTFQQATHQPKTPMQAS